MKCKKKYMIICRLVDCEEDFGLFPLLKDMKKEDGDIAVFDTVAEARKAMKADYETFCESYVFGVKMHRGQPTRLQTADAEWSANGKDPCKRNVGKDEIEIKVPVYDVDNDRDSWIVAKWKIVGL